MKNVKYSIYFGVVDSILNDRRLNEDSLIISYSEIWYFFSPVNMAINEMPKKIDHHDTITIPTNN